MLVRDAQEFGDVGSRDTQDPVERFAARRRLSLGPCRIGSAGRAVDRVLKRVGDSREFGDHRGSLLLKQDDRQVMSRPFSHRAKLAPRPASLGPRRLRRAG